MDELEKIREEKMKERLVKSTAKPKTKIDVMDADFEKEVIAQSETVPVLVDFWASWCMPCGVLGPVLEKLAEEYGGRFVLAKVDVNKAPESSRKYEIMGIPAVKLFRNGKVVDEFVGVKPAQIIRPWLDKNLG